MRFVSFNALIPDAIAQLSEKFGTSSIRVLKAAAPTNERIGA